MKKKMNKKLLSAALLTTVLISSGTMTAFAEPKGSMMLGETLVTGEVSIDSSGATAKTACPRPAVVTVQCDVYYWYGNKYYYSTEKAGVNGGTAAATALKKIDGAEVTGARGYHYVFFDHVAWRGATKTGNVNYNATYL